MRKSTFALWFAAAFLLAGTAFAQRAPVRRVLVTTIRPDRIGDFEAAVKQYVEAYAKVPGVGSVAVMQSLTGTRHYLQIRDAARWSDLDPNPVSKALAANLDLVRINERIRGCVEGSTMLVEELLPELSTTTTPSEPPTMIRMARSRIRSDKTAEFEAIVRNELLPGSLKAGVKSFSVRRVRFGGPTTDYYISTRVDSWADATADKLSKAMGAEAYRAMVAKLTAITTSRDINLYRFRQDLSYHAPTVASSATSAAAH